MEKDLLLLAMDIRNGRVDRGYVVLHLSPGHTILTQAEQGQVLGIRTKDRSH